MKLLLTIASLVFFISTANSTVHIVTAQNSPLHFLPDTVFAMTGDTIRWVYVEGVHDVGPISSADIPNGAAMWLQLIDASNLSFDYVVTVAGSYHYECHPSTPHGEPGYLEVSEVVPGVAQYNASINILSVYPNPSNGSFLLKVDHLSANENNEVKIFDIQGKMVHHTELESTNLNIDLRTQKKGIYFVKFYNSHMTTTKKIVIR